MKHPDPPPPLVEALSKAADASRIVEIAKLARDDRYTREYLHWDRLRHLPVPDGFTPEEIWASIKLSRIGMREVPLADKKGHAFRFCVPELLLEELHKIDSGAGGAIGLPEPVANPQTKNQYLVRSLIEEAITSSQLEGAVTTRDVANEMIRSGRAPRDTSEQMILNNFHTMQRITELRSVAMTPQVIFELHRLVTEKTLDDPGGSGRRRRADERRAVMDEYGEVFHEPPPADQLEGRMAALCEFANERTPAFFVHPVIRAIILHFWLAYDHPFVDGNGRTARALFYWSMLHSGCWLFEFISISSILRKAPAQYARSFLYTESDDNDLTYFIVAQAEVIRRAIGELHAYIARQTKEVRDLESHLRALRSFNHRQVDLLRHALKHPHQEYTFESHQMSHRVAYQTARTDLLELHSRGLLEQRRGNQRGKQLVFTVPGGLADRLRKMGAKAS